MILRACKNGVPGAVPVQTTVEVQVCVCVEVRVRKTKNDCIDVFRLRKMTS